MDCVRVDCRVVDLRGAGGRRVERCPDHSVTFRGQTGGRCGDDSDSAVMTQTQW